MKKIRKITRLFVACLVCLAFFAVNYIDANASVNNITLQGEDGETDIVLVKERVESSTYVTGRGYTYNFQYYIPATGQVVCRMSMTVGFTYDHEDGNARITSFTYDVIYVAPSFSVGNFNKSTVSVGNPAKATLTYKIYHNGLSAGTGTTEARCYNTGTIDWY